MRPLRHRSTSLMLFTSSCRFPSSFTSVEISVSGHCRNLGSRPISSSVCSAEVGKFSALSKTWWDPRENPLIGMNGTRVQYIQDQVKGEASTGTLSPFSGLKALDVGCGGGLLSESLARLGATVTAIDPSNELVQAARWHSQLDPRTRSIEFRGGFSVEALAAENDGNEGKYDIICLLEVLEHVTDPSSVISSIHGLLKPSGNVFVSTLNRTAKSKLVAIWGAEYVMRYLPIGTHDWNEFRSPKEVEELMSQNGFLQAGVSGMVMNSPPLFGQWDWRLDEKDFDVNWIGAYQKLPKANTQPAHDHF